MIEKPLSIGTVPTVVGSGKLQTSGETKPFFTKGQKLTVVHI